MGCHIAHAGSIKNHKNAFLNDPKSQKWGFLRKSFNEKKLKNEKEILFVVVVGIFVVIVVIVVVIVVITDVEQVLLGRYSSPLQWSPQPNK